MRLRTHARTLVVIALTIGLVGTVILTAFAGSQRTSTALGRLRDATLDSDLTITRFGTTAHDDLADRIRRSRYVTGVGSWDGAVLFPRVADGGTDADFALVLDREGRVGAEVDRPLLVAGRRPKPDALDEVLLSEPAAEAYGLDVGDHLIGGSIAPATIACLMAETCGFPEEPDGPPIDLTIVGIGRRPDEVRQVATKSGLYGLPSRAYATTVGPELGQFASALSVRLVPGADARAGFERELQAILADVPNADVLWSDAEYVDPTQSSLDTNAVALLVFGLVAAIAGFATVAQMTTRELSAADDLDGPLRAIGMTRQGRAVALTAPLLLAVVAGATLAGVGSLVASGLMPIGLARQAEPSPGIAFDPLVQVGGTLLLAIVLTTSTAVSGWRAVTRDERTRATRPPSLDRIINAATAHPSSGVGIRFAFSSQAGRTRVPARSAFAAVTVAIAGIIGAAVIVHSVDSLAGSPSRLGFPWSARPDATRPDADAVVSALQRDDRVAAFGSLHSGQIEGPGGRLRAYAIEDLKGQIGPSLIAGRAPANEAEIALGQATMDDWDVDIGDTVTADPIDGGEPVELLVVGSAVIPPIDEDTPGRGAILSPAGLGALDRSASTNPQPVLRYATGVDISSTEHDLAETLGLEFNVYSRPLVPGAVRNLQRSTPVMIWLAVTLATLGILGLTHTLVVSTRRRVHELATLRAIGFRPGQARATVRWQAVTIALLGVLVGVPLGLILGRQIWAMVVGNVGVLDDATVPWWLLLVAMPVAALATALAVAWLPSRRAGRTRFAEALRVG